MRASTMRVSAAAGGVGPFHRAVIETSGVRLVALHELRLLRDGSTVMLYEYTGCRETAEDLARTHLEADADGTAWNSGQREDAQLMYAHAEPSELLRDMLQLLEHAPVVVDWPIRFATDGAAIVTLIGPGDWISGRWLPDTDEIDIRIERIGEYTNDPSGLAPDLTDRELRTLRTAVTLGHYENPRAATYDDIAQDLNCSTGTVGHHLRNAEAKLMQHMFG